MSKEKIPVPDSIQNTPEQPKVRDKNEILNSIAQKATEMTDIHLLLGELRKKDSLTTQEGEEMARLEERWQQLQADTTDNDDWQRWLEENPEFVKSLSGPPALSKEEELAHARKLLDRPVFPFQ